MNVFTRIIIAFSFLLSGFSCANAFTQVEAKENQTANYFVGEWSFSSYQYGKVKSWFAIRVYEQNERDHLIGFIIDPGTLSQKKGDTLIKFHRIGKEYWGEMNPYSSPSPCKILVESTSTIKIIKESGYEYYGKRINNNIEYNNLSPLENNLQNENPTEFNPKNSSSLSDASFTATGYGEISEITGRAKTVHVNGYYRKDGTYVKPHYRSPPRK